MPRHYHLVPASGLVVSLPLFFLLISVFIVSSAKSEISVSVFMILRSTSSRNWHACYFDRMRIELVIIVMVACDLQNLIFVELNMKKHSYISNVMMVQAFPDSLMLVLICAGIPYLLLLHSWLSRD